MTGPGHFVFGLAAGSLAYTLSSMEVTIENVGMALATASVSALAADLDEPNSKLSKKLTLNLKPTTLKAILIGLSVLVVTISYFAVGFMIAASIAAMLGIVGFTYGAGQGKIRQMMLTVIGLLIAMAGLNFGYPFMIGLGAFIAVAPWTKHRTVTHTIWALAFWGWISFDFANTVGMQGLMYVGIVSYASHLVADSLTKARVKWLWPLIKTPIGLPIIRVGSKSGNTWEYAINLVMVGIAVFVAI